MRKSGAIVLLDLIDWKDLKEGITIDIPAGTKAVALATEVIRELNKPMEEKTNLNNLFQQK